MRLAARPDQDRLLGLAVPAAQAVLEAVHQAQGPLNILEDRRDLGHRLCPGFLEYPVVQKHPELQLARRLQELLGTQWRLAVQMDPECQCYPGLLADQQLQV